ncbi:uncharacterized protein CDAR_295241 [Caerostris darwini]|uniref:Crustacean cardioactive peptide n=1 Tax=Caerostris darwini TaxID=1538125 RepID=A0AAV4UME2_9ARAC|nr:uncharacterized protein CDAR_295241 [Caerostris darwini]
MVSSTCLTFILLSVLAIIYTVSSESMDQDRMDLPILQKRPFCNAFTGCGRKRSGLRGSDAGDVFGSRQGSQNKLYSLLQQKMAEVEALRGILDEVSFYPFHDYSAAYLSYFSEKWCVV